MRRMTMIEIPATTLPEVMRAARGAAGLSTRALAPMLGVSHGTVSAWEKGTSTPSVTQFLRWAEAVGQPADRLLRGLAA